MSKEKTAPLSPDEKRALVQRVVSSQSFSRAPALRGFLVYITEHAISGRTEKLKEHTIGTEVLGRKPNYDPADDNIVRVRAHELRGRLEKYFASEGAAEEITITIPRGAYAPEFAPRKSAPAELTTAPAGETRAAEAVASLPAKEPAPVGTSKRFWLFGIAVLLIAILATFFLTRATSKPAATFTATEPAVAIRDFWSQFFERPNEELKVVYSDTSFALWQDLSGQTLNLGEYLNHKYLNVNDDKFFNVASRRVTSPADIAISSRLGVLAGEFSGQISPRFARDASAEFLRSGNAVLIGSHRSNPWVEVFEPNLNFILSQDAHSGAPQFLNRTPQSKEAPVYSIPAMFDTQRVEEKEFNSYAVVALLKGCGNRGLTVLTEGLNTQATQAAGDIVTDPQRLEALLRSIGHKPGTTVAPFEALIQITSLPAEYDNPKVVAYRIRPADSCVGN
jgi:hypothetical protein